MVTRRVLTARWFLLCCALVVFSLQSLAQGSFVLRLAVRDGDVGVDTLLFGRDPRGTYCLDTGPYYDYEALRNFNEFELPPVPPAGIFDTRFGNNRSGLGGCQASNERGNGLRNDIRGIAQAADTFQVKFQVGGSGPITFNWQSGLGVYVDSMRLRDPFGGIIANIDMLSTQVYEVTSGSLTSMNIIMYRTPVVTLVSPSAGNTVPPTVTLTWDPRPGATKYRVQVATDSTFDAGVLVVNDSTVAGPSRVVSGLTSPTTYYWRVSAGGTRGWSRFSPHRMFRTGAVPAAPTLVSPGDGATNQPTSIPFRWTTSVEAATYHLQISTSPTFASFVFNDSTITDTTRTVSSLAFSTTYHWRVAARNGVGSSAFSTAFSFSTQLQPPTAPTLTSPANGSTGLPTTVSLSWSGAGASSYRVQVGTDSQFVSGVFLDDTTVTTTTRQVTGLANNTRYFWRVTGKNGAGYGPPSSIFNFTTIIAAPAAPTLVSPPNNATNVVITPTLTWNQVATAVTYHLQVARDAGFTQITFNDSTLTGLSQALPALLSNTTYFWHVRAKNAGGNGAFSSTFQFLTSAAPPIPIQLLPADSAILLPRTPTFAWFRVAGATAYHVQVSTSAAFTTLLVNDSTITDSTRQLGPFPYGSQLYWRIRSRNTAGASVFTSAWTFTIMREPPATPALSAPANNAVNQNVSTTFRWQSTPLAASYNLVIAYDTLMTNIFRDITGVPDSFAVIQLAPSTAYYWKVRGQNTEGTYGPFSLTRRLTTANSAPAAPLPFLPANNATNVSRTPTLRWEVTPGASNYRVQLAFDNLFTQLVRDDSTVVPNEYQPGLLLANTVYYWRVRARGSVGWSAYSIIHRFTTGELIVSVGDDPVTIVPDKFVLYQNYPNPFNPSTTIRYDVGTDAFVTMQILNILGQQVSEPVSGHHHPGTYAISWNGYDDAGQPVPSGVYLLRMAVVNNQTAQATVLTQKMLLLK